MQRDSRRHTTNGREVENNVGEDRLEGVVVPEPTDLGPQDALGDGPRWESGETRPVTNHFELQRDDDLDDDDEDEMEDDLILGDEDELDEEDEDEVADVEFDDELDEDDIDEDDLFINADDDEEDEDDLA